MDKISIGNSWPGGFEAGMASGTARPAQTLPLTIGPDIKSIPYPDPSTVHSYF